MDIISRNEIIQINILEFLDKEDKWYLKEEIGKECGYSQKTVSKYIDKIKLIISRWDKSEVELQMNPHRGVYLYRSNEFGIQKIFTEILKESVQVQMIEYIFKNKGISKNKFCMEGKLTESTYNKKIRSIRVAMQRYGIFINRNNGEIEGYEEQIRIFFFDYYWNIYRGVDWPFKDIDKEKIIDFISSVAKNLLAEIPVTEILKLSYFIAVAIQRNRLLVKCRFNYDKLKFIKNNNLVLELTSNIEKSIDYLDLLKNKEERALLFIWIIGSNSFKSEKLDSIAEAYISKSSYINLSLEFWLNSFNKIFKVKLSNKHLDYIKDELSKYHIHSYTFQGNLYLDSIFLKPKIEAGITFNENLKNMYRELEGTNLTLFENKSFLLPLYSMIINKIIDKKIVECEIKINVCSDFGILHKQAIQEKLQRYVDGKYNIKFTNNKYESDILLTNVELNLKNIKKDKLILIRSCLSNRDIQRIESCMTEIIRLKRV